MINNFFFLILIFSVIFCFVELGKKNTFVHVIPSVTGVCLKCFAAAPVAPDPYFQVILLSRY